MRKRWMLWYIQIAQTRFVSFHTTGLAQHALTEPQLC